MSFIKCFDIVSMATDEASKCFAPLFKEDDEKKDILKDYCEAIDGLKNEFGVKSLEADVDEKKMTVSVKLDCEYIELQSMTHIFYGLAERAVSLEFSHGEEDTVAVKFVFPGIWEKAL